MARVVKASQVKSAEKPPCPVTRQQFLGKAGPLQVTLGDRPLVISTREFSTGSFGWYAGDKVTLTVDGVPVRCQVGITVTVIGSKDS